jgi:hypothetical protein
MITNILSRQYAEKAADRSSLLCGAFNEQDIEAAFNFLEENGMPMFDSREVSKLREPSNRGLEKIRICEC